MRRFQDGRVVGGPRTTRSTFTYFEQVGKGSEEYRNNPTFGISEFGRSKVRSTEWGVQGATGPGSGGSPAQGVKSGRGKKSERLQSTQ